MRKTFFMAFFLLIAFVLVTGCDIPVSGNPQSVENGQLTSRQALILTESEVGFDKDGFFYSFWTNTSGSVMTMDGGGNYTAQWSNSGNGNIVCGKGWAKGREDRIVEYSASSFNGGNLGYLCLYGWMDNPAEAGGLDPHPVVEYYVVEDWDASWGNAPPGSGDGEKFDGGEIEVDDSTYHLWKTERIDRHWVVDDGLGTFWQYWSIRVNKRNSGSINFQAHVDGWAAATWSKGDYGKYYQIMATEGFNSTGNSNVTVSTSGSAGDLVDKTFWGQGDMDPETLEAGDNRGGYKVEPGEAVFETDFPELGIAFHFYDKVGNTIGLVLDMTLAAFMTDPHTGEPTIRLIPYPGAYIGMADIVDNTIVMNKATAEFVADFLDNLKITIINPDIIGFYYEFKGNNPFIGYGVASVDGSLSLSSRSVSGLSGGMSRSITAQQMQSVLDLLRPETIPITWVPNIGYGEYNGTIKPEGSAFNIKSGPWNGYVQIDFVNPYTYAVQPVKMLLIDENGHLEMYDFADPNGTNPYYYTWGANIPLPSPNTRYRMVFLNYMDADVNFKARVW